MSNCLLGFLREKAATQLGTQETKKEETPQNYILQLSVLSLKLVYETP